MPSTERLSEDSRRNFGGPERPQTWLVRIGSAARPTAPPAIFPLDDDAPLPLGRDMDPDHPDPWMSAEHARVEREDDAWMLIDLGSSNGTFYWGEQTSRQDLVDGDIFETGGTFWCFRRMVAPDGLPRPPFEGPLATLFPPLAATYERLARVARTRVPVMLLGATGTGKEVVARQLHALSKRDGAFVAINTAAVQKTLVASELFGVEKGAHSTAEQSRLGRVRTADRGTLLLDEIGDMPLEVQVALLRMLQESEIVPVGGDTPVRVDVRTVCATHQNLESMVDRGAFRADLFARLNGCRLTLPDLAERVDDLGLLVAHFVRAYGDERLSFSAAAYRALVLYSWPLNIRELEQAVQTAAALSRDQRIELHDLPDEIAREAKSSSSARSASQPPPPAVGDEELLRLLKVHKGNLSAVGRALGRSRMQIHRRVARLGVDLDALRRS